MAPILETPRSAQEALQKLEKDTTDPATQLREVAHTVGIDLDQYARRSWSNELARLTTTTKNTTTSAPREEWVLRALMKKLKASAGQEQGDNNNYRLHENSWHLLRALFDRIPSRSLAIILHDNKFLQILKDTLVEIGNRRTCTDARPGLGDRQTSDSSATLQGSPVLSSPKRGKKRKRGDPDAESSVTGSWVDVFLSVLIAIRTLVAQIQHDASGPANSQLQVVLRGEPQIVADILSHSFESSAAIIKEWGQGSAVKTEEQLLSSLVAILELWRLRSDRLDDATHRLSNDAFYSRVLPQALKLCLNLHDSRDDAAGKHEVLQNVERLVVLHTILPLRQAFLTRRVAKPRPDNVPASDEVELICKDVKSHLGEQEKDLTPDLLPVLFDIAVRAVPRDTFRRQVNEAPWLEALLVSLATRAGYPIFEAVASATGPSSTLILERFLQVAFNRKVTLSLDTLCQYAVKFSGLAGDKSANLEWSLIAQIIRGGIDVFLPNSGLEASANLLQNLMSRITALWLHPVPLSNDTYYIIKADIVVRLVEGFSAARDITSFTQIWQEQLQIVESARAEGENIAAFSVWEDDDVAEKYSNLISSSFLAPQFLDQVQSTVTEISAETGNSAKQYARVVILDAILITQPQGDDNNTRSQVFEDVLSMASKIILSKASPHWQWRLWRLTDNLIASYPASVEYTPIDLKSTLLPAAVRLLQKFHQRSKKTKNSSATAFLTAFEAFRFVVLLIGKADSSQFNEHLDELIPTLVPFIHEGPKSEATHWNGRVDSMDSPQALAVGYLTALLANPLAVSKLTSENRRLLFNGILTAIEHSKVACEPLSSTGELAAKTLQSQFLDVWSSFVSPEWLLNASPAVYDLVNTLYNHIKEKGAPSELLISNLLNIPPQLIPRHQRAMLLDLLQEMILQSPGYTSEITTNILTLMTRLADMAKSSAKLTSDWDELWKLADAIRSEEPDSPSTLPFRPFCQLYKSAMDKILGSSDAQREQCLQQLYKRAVAAVKKLETPEYGSMKFFMLALSLSTLEPHEDQLKDTSRGGSVEALRKKVLNVVIADLQSMESQLKKRPEKLDIGHLLGALDVLEEFRDLLKNNKEAQRALRKLNERADKADLDTTVRKRVKDCFISIQSSRKDMLPSIMESIPLFPVGELQGDEQRIFLGEVRKRLASLSEDKLASFLHDVRGEGFLGPDATSRLLLAGMAVSTFDSIEDRDSEASQEISSALTALSDCLSTSVTLEAFCLAAECIETLLRTQARSVTQWNVDNLITSIAVTVSSSGPNLDAEAARTVYTRLCRILGMLFGQYRTKLSGRYHLILPVMQRLLRCLFSRDPRASKSAKTTSSSSATMPPWTDNLGLRSSSSSSNVLTSEQAVQYTRLLAALCDPTVSAVQQQQHSHNHNRPNLTDNTKKVKSLSGQHLQYLITEYTSCQLHSQLAPEMKTALMPGLYAVLDVMSKETMRGMNAAMDASSRAVFKGLYEDYTRFGRWNHD
ncbi:hypothetical protein AJ80_04771 [Polytolypa hystricis UAMH7299]|uniref:Nucleolar 27S pre-rRNA processing Urb2/Npa2 C-terminal domain-containing protein n=1 Tax=Polytolypa hystricis (strain UAMH7299) TaxID=1447883 RepID=A0A2B7Y9P5_POLH7|nr:hypothetical protein AJ80_04771 [Polytolypa hystricis UAMH7299]